MGATTSGLAPVDGSQSNYMSKMFNTPFEAPLGGKNLDTYHYRVCGDKICIHDHTSSGDFFWEQIRREGASTDVPFVNKFPSERVEKTVAYPDTKVTLYDANKGPKIGGEIASHSQTYVLRLPIKTAFM
jgi:hypothetical protein